MICGMILPDEIEEECYLAFLGDGVQTFSVGDVKEIIELMEKFEPEIVASNTGMEQSTNEMTESEEDLKEEGYAFIPNSFEEKKVEMMQTLKRQTELSLRDTEFIRFDPNISAGELGIENEKDLEDLGVEADGEIENAREFDAVLGAVTGQLYLKSAAKDLGVVVPELEEDQNT